MGSFNLNDYETVDSRLKKLIKEHEDFSIRTYLVSPGNVGEEACFRAEIFLGDKPKSTGWAYEKAGDGYVNKTSWVENCETSAIGRALANMGYSGDKRASREEMEKTQRMAPQSPKPEETVAKVFDGEIVGDVKLEDVVKLVNQLPNAEMVDWMRRATEAKAAGSLGEVYKELQGKVNG